MENRKEIKYDAYILKNNDDRKLVRDYFNNVYEDKEIINMFELEQCPLCKQYELGEDMLYHKWDIGQVEEQICETCRGDE